MICSDVRLERKKKLPMLFPSELNRYSKIVGIVTTNIVIQAPRLIERVFMPAEHNKQYT